MNEEKQSKKTKKRKSRVKMFFLRTAASALIFGILALVTTYEPQTSAYIKNEIDYNTDFAILANGAKQFMIKYTPLPQQNY